MSFQASLPSRIRQDYFRTPLSSLITLTGFTAAILIFFELARWGIVDATFAQDAAVCKAGNGACWGFIHEKWRIILFGRYPFAEQWRAGTSTAVIVAALLVSALPFVWRRLRLFAGLWSGAFIIFFTLMYGGVFGLPKIETGLWGGLPLTVILTIIGMSASAPIGILLAFGRKCGMPVLRFLCAGYIELVRGVPLITVLFVATYIFPMILPDGMTMDAFWRVTIGIVLFQAAYMAETVRGGLQTIPRGQGDAAYSLGMSTWQVNVLVLLPQALLCIIPAFVNSLLSTFMDTSLVTVVSMYDLTGALRLALGDPVWRSFFIEGYLFVAAIYFFSSLAISRYSFWLERYLNPGKENEGPAP